MTFDDLVSPADVFVDANTFIYHFTADPKWGAACTRLLERIEFQELRGFISTKSTLLACLERASIPRLPVPAKRSSTRAPFFKK